ncbi:hypothetical protein G6F70_002679 [Rhizopus microsporus]|uniref:Major facilitator superfamily (MFS) profile domain-containing protein n=2 Tax=Rhizopus TaxID=4842 RepID=A0A367J2P5_RHIAZ|nr:hypothetical protein G6F71_002695 [Rhizopus microsporus]RCH84217.1 hypothetical protein CU097_004391 [Rhizopus azygosporus]KAG1201972.1 hypothetical protein G6F70_002679 [Rhizopus microsporus]KAG1213847.1 hypothetical protein G6F69_002464 [Rhizopus microsporus]KAG1237579.1 hypothetical protein G6F67_001114 [Rhizopus microsporus]
MATSSEGSGDSRFKGVTAVELYKQIWTDKEKYIIFLGLFLFSWASNFEGNLTMTLNNKVTSFFQSNNLISLLSTITYILQTALLPIYSKLSDMFGRAHCYSVGFFFYILAFIVMATANNYNTLVGGQIIYAFGYSGVSILGPIVVGDLTTVTNRGLFQGLYNLPSLFNIFVAPRAAALLLDQGRWRWGYGLCCIILGGTAVPLIGGLWYVHFKLKRSGLIEEYKAKQAKTEEPKMNIFQKFIWLMTEIDIIGSLLLIAGLCLILLPLVLALPKWGGWSSGITIGTLVAGVVAWILFAIWEWKFARKPVIPLARWNTHTPLLGVLALSTVTLISSTNWQYFTTYLLVSRKVSIDTAIYLERGYNVAYIVCETTVGYLMKRTRKWRPFVWVGVSLTILGVGLMIPARLPSSSDAFVVISQTIVGIGSGCLYTPILVAIQSSVPHSDLAVVTAMMQVGGSIAASVGSTMSGAIWNSMLPGQLAKYVPGEYDYAKIVGSTDYAISLPKEQYDGVVQAYGHIQMILSIIAICIAVLTFCFTVPMKSFGLEDAKDADDTTSLKETPVEDYKSSSTTKL